MKGVTQIRDAVLATMSGDLGDAEVLAVEDAALSATRSAAMNDDPLLDFDEFDAVGEALPAGSEFPNRVLSEEAN